MQPFTFRSKAGDIEIRQIETNDIPALIALNKRVFPLMAEENVVWSARQLANHLKVYPEDSNNTPRLLSYPKLCRT